MGRDILLENCYKEVRASLILHRRIPRGMWYGKKKENMADWEKFALFSNLRELAPAGRRIQFFWLLSGLPNR